MYGSVRKSVVDASFKKLGVEILSIGDIESLEWEALAAKIGKWIRFVKLCVRVLFASEKRLSQLIFQDLGTKLIDSGYSDRYNALCGEAAMTRY
ncbi:hypothetical protein R6Q59_036173 [Mikania micrantha]